MTTRHQSNPTSAERTAPYGLPTADEYLDDPIARLHRYQQRLRAELLEAAADGAMRPSRWQRLWGPPLTPPFTVATVRAIEGRFKALAISRHFRRLKDGGLTVESTDGEGSTFTRRLPSAAVEPSASDNLFA